MRPTIIFCPGGAYARLSDREAEPPAFEFYVRGFQTFILRYSLGEKAKDKNPLMEASQALRRNHIPCECHLFADGEHGSSTCKKEVRTVNPQCAAWVSLAAAWMEKLFDFEE